MRRPSLTLLLGIVSGLMLLGGGGWILSELVSNSSPSPDKPEKSRAATSDATSLSEQIPATESPDNTTDTEAESENPADATEDDSAHSPSDSESDSAAYEAVTPVEARTALNGITVALDPGHNGGNAKNPAAIARLVDAGNFQKACDTTGTSARDGTTEAAYALSLARRVKKLLESQGATVIMTRKNNAGVGPCINQRAAITNRADIALSIHADGNVKKGARGFHVIVPAPKNARSKQAAESSHELGESIRDSLVRGKRIPVSNYLGHNGIDIRSDLGGLNLSTVPKVLVETGNMKNKDDMIVLGTAPGQDALAVSLVSGLARWLAVKNSQS